MRSCIKTGIMLLALVALVATYASAGWRPEVVLGPGVGSGTEEYHQTWNRTLAADTLYTLTGSYYVDSLFVFTIEPGTVVQGDSGACLVIRRGAEIHARGTVDRPIVFTSSKAPGDRNPGDWAGVIILGEAPCNKVNPLIEGGLIEGTYGGTDPNDDSGEFYYCRIEYPGYRLAEGNEVNGLTLGGVGRNTEIHHVQSSYANDDAFEWFGGNCDSDYLVSLGNVDDCFDTDFGHTGRHQFLFCLRDPQVWDPTGQSNGFESDNDGTATGDTPYTEPIFCNNTLIGPEYNDDLVGHLPPGYTFEYEAVIRRCTKHKVFNSALAGWPWGVSVRDACTKGFALADVVKIKNTSVQASRRPGVSTSVHDETRWNLVTAWFDTPAYGNLGSQPRNPSTLGFTDMSDFNDPDPVPAAGSELIGSASFADPDLAGLEVVTYRGAFDPEKPMSQQWTAGWTNFDPQNTEYNPDVAAIESVQIPGQLSQNAPNPFNPVTRIAYSVKSAGRVTIEVHNIAGRLVRTLLSDELEAGAAGSVVWDGKDDSGQSCASGVYFYTLSAADVSETHKMVMLK